MKDRLNDSSLGSSRYIAQKCPVCNSFGTLKYGSVVCHACQGRGYIVIDNKTGLPVEKGGQSGRLDKTSPKTS